PRPTRPPPLFPYTTLFRSVAIGVRHSRGRKIDRPIVALTRQRVEDRSARISEPQQLRHLVVCLARGIVSSTADAFVRAGRVHQIDRKSTRLNSSHGSISYA